MCAGRLFLRKQPLARLLMCNQLVLALESLSEQARAKALSGDVSPPTVAHPAFITMSLRE
jgi:hypothetical protein